MFDIKFHHIAVACKNIEESIKSYKILGYELSSKIFKDKTQNVKVCFLDKKKFPKIELVEPLDEKSPVNDILRKQGTTAYHFCYLTSDILKSIETLKKEKFILLRKPVEAIAFNNKKICFLYNKNVGLMELVEL